MAYSKEKVYKILEKMGFKSTDTRRGIAFWKQFPDYASDYVLTTEDMSVSVRTIILDGEKDPYYYSLSWDITMPNGGKRSVYNRMVDSPAQLIKEIKFILDRYMR